jgi:hypothetical protein
MYELGIHPVFWSGQNGKCIVPAMKYLALAVLLAVVQTPAPVPRKASHNSAPGSHNVKNHADANKAPATQPQPSAQPVSPSPGQNNRQSVATENDQKAISIAHLPPVSVIPGWLDCISLGFAGILVIVGTCGVRAAYRTLRAIQSQAVHMRQQTGILRESVSAANKNAEAAAKNASALVNIERAWLVVEVSVPRTLSENIGGGAILQGVGFTWIVRNCGKTSGFITRTGARFHAVKAFSDVPLEPNIDMPGVQAAESYAFGVPIGPGDTIRRCRMLEGENRHPTTAEEKLITDGALTYLGYGVIEYKTVLDETIHRSWFCHRWLPGTLDPFPPSPVPANYTQYT